MNIELLVALSKFYEVFYDYILGFSDTRYPEREDITKKYDLTDSDVINAMFESTEFQSLVDLIRTSATVRSRATETNYYDSIKARGKFVYSLSKKQKAIAKEGALSVLATDDAKDFIDFKIQRAITAVVYEILDNL